MHYCQSHILREYCTFTYRAQRCVYYEIQDIIRDLMGGVEFVSPQQTFIKIF